MLKNVTTNIMEKIADMEDLELSHFEYFFQLDETFEAMNQILLWLQQLADSLDVGFSLLANGHLAPQIVSPAKFNEAILPYNVIHSLLSDNVLLMFGYDLRRNLVSPSVISLSPAILSKLENFSSSLDYSHFYHIVLFQYYL